MSERELDVVVVGAGAPGEVAAGRLGEAALDVAIVEERLVGGECSFFACIPSKALLRPVDLAAEARRVPGLTVNGLDVAAVLSLRVQKLVCLERDRPPCPPEGGRACACRKLGSATQQPGLALIVRCSG